MKIFISWSGSRSKALAAALKDWLPTVLQYVQPWMSSTDINSGERWSNEIAKQLQDTNFGILCVTRENLEAPWLLFEAGALAKSMQDGRVIPLRLDVEPSDITGPLTQFHSEKADVEGVKRLLNSLNGSWGSPLADDVLQNTFAPMWTVFQQKIEKIPESESSPKKSRTQAEILEELVSNVRNVELRLRDSTDDEFAGRRKIRRRMHPEMLFEIAHRLGRGRQDPIQILVVASFFRDELPWLYELGTEAYRAIRSGDKLNARIAIDRFREGAKLASSGRFMDALGIDMKSMHFMLMETMDFIPDFDEVFNEELPPISVKPLPRKRKPPTP